MGTALKSRLLAFLLAIVTTISLLSTTASAVDYVDVWQSAGGSGANNASVTSGGVWAPRYQGFRIAVLDYAGKPAFTFNGKDYLDLLFSYPYNCSYYGLENKTDGYRKASIYRSDWESKCYEITISDLYSGINSGQLSFKTNGEVSVTASNLKNIPYHLDRQNGYWYKQGTKVKEKMYGTLDDKVDINAALFAILNLRANGVGYFWKPKSDIFVGQPYSSAELNALANNQTTPMDLMGSRKLVISVEPIIWNQLRISASQFSRYSVYGTQTDIGFICKKLIEWGTDFAGAAGGGKNGGYDWSLFGNVGRKAMVLTKGIKIHYYHNGTEDIQQTWVIDPPVDNGKPVDNDTVAAMQPGWSLHLYQLRGSDDQTHTYDSHNYPITDPGPHGDNPNYKEHPAPDPKTDPCTSDKINSLLDKIHYRIVKVYDQEVLYASIDENGELTLTKGTEHVSTHVREQTLPKIEVQDEMPEYRMVEWKYTYDQYVPVTEGGTESTKWEDEPIAGRTVVNSDIAA